MYDAVHVATRELGGFGSAISAPRADPEEGTRVMLFMTDGHPTLPVSRAPMENARLAIEAARHAHSFDIRIDTFAIWCPPCGNGRAVAPCPATSRNLT